MATRDQWSVKKKRHYAPTCDGVVRTIREIQSMKGLDFDKAMYGWDFPIR